MAIFSYSVSDSFWSGSFPLSQAWPWPLVSNSTLKGSFLPPLLQLDPDSLTSLASLLSFPLSASTTLPGAVDGTGILRRLVTPWFTLAPAWLFSSEACVFLLWSFFSSCLASVGDRWASGNQQISKSKLMRGQRDVGAAEDVAAPRKASVVPSLKSTSKIFLKTPQQLQLHRPGSCDTLEGPRVSDIRGKPRCAVASTEFRCESFLHTGRLTYTYELTNHKAEIHNHLT